MPSPRRSRPGRPSAFLVLVALGLGLGAFLPPEPAGADGPKRVAVPKALVHVDDGDSIYLAWPGKPVEHVRILGIDTPEVLHLDHEIPYAQPFGGEASGFLRGCLAVTGKVELLRSGNVDDYGRTLAYVFLDSQNYSLLVIGERLAYGPSPRFGDNGLPEEYAACLAAAKAAGPPAFEPPWQYRRRMREVSAWLKKQGRYPQGPAAEEPKSGK